MKVFLTFLALLVAPTALLGAPSTLDLNCNLTNSPPRTPGSSPDTFKRHLRIDFTRSTVNGEKATITASKIGWATRFQPYATLTRPDWHYASAGQMNRTAYTVTGSCTEKQ